MSKLADLTGQTFGSRTVLRRGPPSEIHRSVRWVCFCSACGQEKLVFSQSLRRGAVCRCQFKMPRVILHGLSGTPEHKIYHGMLKRCSNPNVIGYHHYGGAGIRVCDRWINGDGIKSGFSCFLDDMGKRPSSDHSIDRYPNPSGNYEPGNCRWATNLEQVNNRKNTRFVVYKGERMPLTDAVRKAGSVIHYEAAWIRICWNWPVEKAVETPSSRKSAA